MQTRGKTIHVSAADKNDKNDRPNCCHRCLNKSISAEFATDELPLRQKFQVLMRHSRVGMLWDVLMMVLSLITIAMFVYSTYAADGGRSILCNAEITLAAIFTIDYIFQWLAAPNYVTYPFSFYSAIDLITIIPVYMEVINMESGCFVQGFEDNSADKATFLFIRIMRLFKILRILRYLRGGRGFSMMSLVYLKMFRLGLTFVIIIFFGAGCVYVAENVLFEVIHGGNMTYLNSLRIENGEDPFVEWTFGNCM